MGDEAEEVSIEGMANNSEMKHMQKRVEKDKPNVRLENGSDVLAYLRHLDIHGNDIEKTEIRTIYQI